MATDVFLVSGIRTPMGAMGGSLAEVSAQELGALCIKSSLEKAKIPFERVDEVIMGNVVAAGLGQNPARQATLRSGLSPAVAATTVNKVCGSGLKAVMLAAQAIQGNDARLVVAGGMENMSRAPYLLLKGRQGYRMGHDQIFDSMILDGLWDVYGDKHMGIYGDRCALHAKLTRQDQDDFAVRSYTRAKKAIAEGVFTHEIVPVPILSKKGTTVVTADEGPARFDESKLRGLKAAFAGDGTVTAGNASSISDGAAALVVASRETCEKLGCKPVARIVGYSTFSREPEWFTLAPIGAINRLFERTGWSNKSTDLFEINEAFAAVTLAAERELGLPSEKVNIFGGAVSLGHPIGASGARIVVTLLTGLQRTGGKRGIACLCIGGGEAVALAVETVPS